jgi:hypothetical protein
MLKRKIISDLERWLHEPSKKALLLKGARQVGKTTTVREFAKNNYAHFVEINFEKLPMVKQAFDGNLDAETIISKLSLMGFGPFVEHQTLVFFDEIQTCPNARTAIKFLVEDGRFDYIESGSLLGLHYADVSSYPVGFEYSVNMYPLDFEEFLWAKGVAEKVVETIKTTLHNRMPIDDFMHEQLSKTQELLQQMVLSAIPIEDVDKELMKYPPGLAWDMLRDLNANVLVNVQRAWRENYPALLEKHRQRLFEPINQQKDLTDAMWKVAERPANLYNYGAGAVHDDKRQQMVFGEEKEKLVPLKRLTNE